MSKKAIGDRRFVITKNLIMMLVMLVVIIAAIFAWYSNNTEVTASGTSISAKAADKVELALPEKTGNTYHFPVSNDSWSHTLEFADSGFLKNLVKDVTSNGKQFVVPNFEAASGLKDGRKVIEGDIWTEGLSSKTALSNNIVNDDDQYNYISLDFYARSKTKDINITSNSFLAAGCETGYSGDDSTGNQLLTGANTYRKSSYGGTSNVFSADAIVGAMRVSLVGAPVDSASASSETFTNTNQENNVTGQTWDQAAALKFVWLPRPDIYLETDDEANNWQLHTGIGPNSQYSDKTYYHSFYYGNTVTGNVKKTLTENRYFDSNVKSFTNTEGSNLYSSPSVFKVSQTTGDSELGNIGHYPKLGQSASITSGNNATAPPSEQNISFTASTLNPNDSRDTKGYYVYKYSLNIWIEGEDAEARRSMNTGVFKLELEFGT